VAVASFVCSGVGAYPVRARTGLLVGQVFVIVSAAVGVLLLFAPLAAGRFSEPFIYELK
jgi:hypothetical protein